MVDTFTVPALVGEGENKAVVNFGCEAIIRMDGSVCQAGIFPRGHDMHAFYFCMRSQ